MTNKEKRIERFWQFVGLALVLCYVAACAPSLIEWWQRLNG